MILWADCSLYGTWRLVSLEFVVSAACERGDIYGPEAQGFIVITPDHRMMTIVTSNDRVRPGGDPAGDALFRSMIAYAGAFRIEGHDRFVTEVDVAWHPSWVGTEQARTFGIEGDILSITTAEVSHPMYPGQHGRGVLRWKRLSAF